MYINIGSDIILREKEIIAVISLRQNKKFCVYNHSYLLKMERQNKIIDISAGKAKSIIILSDETAYISPISTQTIRLRSKKFGLPKGLNKIG